MRLPDPERSRVVLVGSSTYKPDSGFAPLPAVTTNLDLLAGVLRDRTGIAANNICVLPDPHDQMAIRNVLRPAAQEAEDLLLFYFAGHGVWLPDSVGLTYASSELADPDWTTLKYELVRKNLLESAARVKLVVLDCCHSGNAHRHAMGPDDANNALQDAAQIDGSFVLTATDGRKRWADSRGTHGCTAFTGALVDTLQEHRDGDPEYVTMDVIFRRLRENLVSRNLPAPRASGSNIAHQIALVRNSIEISSPDAQLSLGDVFAGYRIIERLRTAGEGALYRARDRGGLPRNVSLKIFGSSFFAEGELRHQFRREVEVVAALNHPNIVTILAAGEENGHLWFATRDVLEKDLTQIIQGPMEPHRAVRIMTDIAAALDCVHQAEVLHGAVQPTSILLTDTVPERALLTGFAASTGFNQSYESDRPMLASTVKYPAPEILMGKAIDHRADVYAFGCTVFEMLTGARPYSSATVAGMVRGHLNEAIPAPSARNPALPVSFDSVIAKALDKDSAARFASCGALAEAVAQALQDISPGSTAPPRTKSGNTAAVASATSTPRQPTANSAHGPSIKRPTDISAPEVKRPDSERSRVVLVGVSSYAEQSGFPPLAGINFNLTRLAYVLERHIGLSPQNISVITNPVDSPSFMSALRSASEAADDLLLFYFVGHAVCHHSAEIGLTHRESKAIHPEWTTVSYNLIRRELATSRAQSKVVILDLCEDTTSFLFDTDGDDRSPDLRQLAEIAGTTVITATTERTVWAKSLWPNGCTAFTGTVADLLLDNRFNNPACLTTDIINEQLARNPLTPPAARQGTGGRSPLVPNQIQITGDSLVRSPNDDPDGRSSAAPHEPKPSHAGQLDVPGRPEQNQAPRQDGRSGTSERSGSPGVVDSRPASGMIIRARGKDPTPWSSAIRTVVNWLKSWSGPHAMAGIAVVHCADADIVVWMPQICVVIGVHSFTERVTGTLTGATDRPWTIDGKPAPIDGDADPLDRVRRQTADLARQLRAAPGREHVRIHGLVLLVPQLGSRIKLDMGRLPTGIDVILGDGPSSSRAYFINLANRFPDASWDAAQVGQALGVLGFAAAATYSDLLSVGFPRVGQSPTRPNLTSEDRSTPSPPR